MNSEFQSYLDEALPQVDFEIKPIKYKVTIEEHVSQTFEVEATDIDEAMKIAQAKYNNGEFVLEPGELTAKLIMAEDEYGADCTEWTEF